MNESLPPRNPDRGAQRFHELSARYLADELDAAELAEFNALLSQNPAYCRELSIFAWHARLMSVRLASELNPDNVADSLADLGRPDKNNPSRRGSPLPDTPARQANPPQVLGFLGTVANQAAAWLASPKVLALTVLASLMTYFVGLMISIAISRSSVDGRNPTDATEALARAAARVVGTAGCRWHDPATAVVGENLPAGVSDLIAGIVEIEFNGGALVRIEGPAQFAPQSGQRLELIRGRLTAFVPWQAHGFVVATPSAEVVDLGTEFGIEVDRDGHTDVHVIQGSVAVHAAPQANARQAEPVAKLTAGQAVRVTAGQQAASSIQFDKTRFDTVRSAKIVTAPPAQRFPEGQPIWLGNLFDDRPRTPLSEAMRSDTFRAAPSFNNTLGVVRVEYGGNPLKDIAGVPFDFANLGWLTDFSSPGSHIANDAYTDHPTIRDEQGPSGGLRLSGAPLNSYKAKKIDEGIGMIASALITFDIEEIRDAGQLQGRAFQFISDRAGVNDGARPTGSVHLLAIVSSDTAVQSVVLDGQPAKFAKRDGRWSVTSPVGEPLVGGGPYASFRVAVPADAKYLTLASTNGDDPTDDLAVWIGARLEVQR